MKTGYSLIDFDVNFPIQSSEFIKSPNFGSQLKKLQDKNLKKSYFHLKIALYGYKTILWIWNSVYSDRILRVVNEKKPSIK